MTSSISTPEVEFKRYWCGRNGTTDHSAARDRHQQWHRPQPSRAYFSTLVGDTTFSHNGTTGVELWAYDTSNHSTWQWLISTTAHKTASRRYLNLLVGDTIYFATTGRPMWNCGLTIPPITRHGSWMMLQCGSMCYPRLRSSNR